MSLNAEDVLESFAGDVCEAIPNQSRCFGESDERLNIAMSFSLIANEGLNETISDGQTNALFTISGPYRKQGIRDITKLLFENRINIISDFGTRIHRKMHCGNFWISGERKDFEKLKADIKARGANEISFAACNDAGAATGEVFPINITCPDTPGVYHQVAEIISKHGALILMHQSDTFLRGDDPFGRIRLKIEIPRALQVSSDTIIQSLASHGRLLGWSIDQAQATNNKTTRIGPSLN